MKFVVSLLFGVVLACNGDRVRRLQVSTTTDVATTAATTTDVATTAATTTDVATTAATTTDVATTAATTTGVATTAATTTGAATTAATTTGVATTTGAATTSAATTAVSTTVVTTVIATTTTAVVTTGSTTAAVTTGSTTAATTTQAVTTTTVATTATTAMPTGDGIHHPECDRMCRQLNDVHSYCKWWQLDAVCRGGDQFCGDVEQCKATVTPTSSVHTEASTVCNLMCIGLNGVNSYCKWDDEPPVCRGGDQPCGPDVCAPGQSEVHQGPSAACDKFCQDTYPNLTTHCKYWQNYSVCEGTTESCSPSVCSNYV